MAGALQTIQSEIDSLVASYPSIVDTVSDEAFDYLAAKKRDADLDARFKAGALGHYRKNFIVNEGLLASTEGYVQAVTDILSPVNQTLSQFELDSFIEQHATVIPDEQYAVNLDKIAVQNAALLTRRDKEITLATDLGLIERTTATNVSAINTFHIDNTAKIGIDSDQVIRIKRVVNDTAIAVDTNTIDSLARVYSVERGGAAQVETATITNAAEVAARTLVNAARIEKTQTIADSRLTVATNEATARLTAADIKGLAQIESREIVNSAGLDVITNTTTAKTSVVQSEAEARATAAQNVSDARLSATSTTSAARLSATSAENIARLDAARLVSNARLVAAGDTANARLAANVLTSTARVNASVAENNARSVVELAKLDLIGYEYASKAYLNGLRLDAASAESEARTQSAIAISGTRTSENALHHAAILEALDNEFTNRTNEREATNEVLLANINALNAANINAIETINTANLQRVVDLGDSNSAIIADRITLESTLLTAENNAETANLSDKLTNVLVDNERIRTAESDIVSDKTDFLVSSTDEEVTTRLRVVGAKVQSDSTLFANEENARYVAITTENEQEYSNLIDLANAKLANLTYENAVKIDNFNNLSNEKTLANRLQLNAELQASYAKHAADAYVKSLDLTAQIYTTIKQSQLESDSTIMKTYADANNTLANIQTKAKTQRWMTQTDTALAIANQEQTTVRYVYSG